MGWHWGILASSGGAAGAFDLLETTLISTNTASVTFSNLNNYSAYKHLQVRYTARSSRTGLTFESMKLRINGVSSAAYAFHDLVGDGSSVGSNNSASVTEIVFGQIPTADSPASIFGMGVIDILDFASSSKNTTIRSLNGYTQTANNRIRLASGFWNNTAAVTSLELSAFSNNLVSGSRFSLYGVK